MGMYTTVYTPSEKHIGRCTLLYTVHREAYREVYTCIRYIGRHIGRYT